MPHDGETETEAAVSAADRRLALAEAVEHERQQVRPNALAGVRDGDPRHRVGPLQPDVHTTAHRRELDRVGEEVPDDLLQAIGVGRDGAEGSVQARLEPDASGVGRGLHRFHRGHDDGDQIDRSDIQAELAGDDAGDVEEVFDQLGQHPGVALDDLGTPAGADGIERPGPQQAHPAQDRVERGAQLV